MKLVGLAFCITWLSTFAFIILAFRAFLVFPVLFFGKYPCSSCSTDCHRPSSHRSIVVLPPSSHHSMSHASLLCRAMLWHILLHSTCKICLFLCLLLYLFLCWSEESSSCSAFAFSFSMSLFLCIFWSVYLGPSLVPCEANVIIDPENIF